MSTSELGYFRRIPESLVGAGDFADTAMCRAVANNLNHLADQRGQVVVNWAPSGTTSSDYLTVYDSSPTVDRYYEMWRSTAFDLPLLEDGSSYRVRVRASVTSNHATYQASFRIGLVRASAGARQVLGDMNRGEDNVVTKTRAATTYAWTASDVVYFDAARSELATTTIDAIDAVGGTTRSAVQVRARIVIAAAVNNAAAEARLNGCHAALFLAP